MPPGRHRLGRAWWARLGDRLGIGRSQVRLALIVSVIGLGAVLRLLALAALPDFFGPGEPATYFAMAQGVLRTGVPRVDFIWNFASLPLAISHIESYAEPAFAYLLAGVMAVFGDRVIVARALATACGVLAPILTFLFARRLGKGVSVVAAAIVAWEPWSIYYSGVLMEETLITVLLLVALEVLRRVLQPEGSARRAGLIAAAVVVGAGAFQYELLPILACAVGSTVFVVRRDALPSFLLALSLAVAAGVAAAWATLGVPVSGKLWFFLGQSLVTPETGARAARVSTIGPARFAPFVYVAGMLLLKWYVALPVLAWIGSRSHRLGRVDLMLPLSVVCAFLYFRGVPHHLWERDFIPFVPVLAPLVALAICRPVLWSTPIGRAVRQAGRDHPGDLPVAESVPAAPRRSAWRELPRGPFAFGLIAGAAGGTWLAIGLLVGGVFPVRSMPWPILGCSILLAALFTTLFLPLSFLLDKRPVRRAMHIVSLGIVLAAYAQMLPWTSIASNPEFPAYAAAHLERASVSKVLSRRLPAAPVMTSAPAETQLSSGFPAVLLPGTHNPNVLLELRRRYGIRYIFARDGELSRKAIATLALEPVARFLGHVVYVFPGDPLLGNGAPGGHATGVSATL